MYTRYVGVAFDLSVLLQKWLYAIRRIGSAMSQQESADLRFSGCGGACDRTEAGFFQPHDVTSADKPGPLWINCLACCCLGVGTWRLHHWN
jgi:hypothetical protein